MTDIFPNPRLVLLYNTFLKSCLNATTLIKASQHSASQSCRRIGSYDSHLLPQKFCLLAIEIDFSHLSIWRSCVFPLPSRLRLYSGTYSRGGGGSSRSFSTSRLWRGSSPKPCYETKHLWCATCQQGQSSYCLSIHNVWSLLRFNDGILTNREINFYPSVFCYHHLQ